MAVARKHKVQEGSTGEAATKRARPRTVSDADAFTGNRNPIAEQLIRLEDAFSPEDAEAAKRYPGRVRLAIMIGAPAALWALIGLAALGLRTLF